MQLFATAGLFLLSVALIARGRDLAGGVVFAVLLNMKHLFACAAPLYFVYLLRHHCRWLPGQDVFPRVQPPLVMFAAETGGEISA